MPLPYWLVERKNTLWLLHLEQALALLLNSSVVERFGVPVQDPGFEVSSEQCRHKLGWNVED